MRKKDVVIFGFAALCLIAALLIVGGSAVAQSRDAAPPPILNFECPAGETCNILWQAGSQGHNLCAGANGQTGRFNLDIYGADSNLLQCVGPND